MSDIKKEIIMKNGYIDVHHHIIPDAYREALAEVGVRKSGGKSIGRWSPEMSLTHMDTCLLYTSTKNIYII